MIDVSKLSKNLIAVSLVSALLVVALGSRYLTSAKAEFSGATQLQQSVAPESMLFEISNSLDQERAATQNMLIGSTRYFDDLDNLNKLSNNTKTLLQQIHQEISQTNAKGSNKSQRLYSDKSVDLQFSELDDKLKRISASRFVIMGQTFRPLTVRDENVRMQQFDVYVNLNLAFNRLRKLTRTYPEKNYVDVIVGYEIKDAIWTINDSINQVSTLIAGSLLKHQSAGYDSLNTENLNLRVLQQLESSSNAIAYLKDRVETNAITDESRLAVQELADHYEDIFRPEAKQLLAATNQKTLADGTLDQWQEISESTKQNVKNLQKAVLNKTLHNVDSIKSSAAINLLFNTCLVSLCMLMAYATFRISKKIQHQANHDELTGLPNRRYFNEALASLFKNTDSKKEKLILMTMDLNGFKSINDTMGHVAGDDLLIQVADRLSDTVSSNVALARMGGDEFAAAYKTNNSEDPYQFACKIRNLFDQAFTIDDGLVNVDTSVGYSTYPADASNIKELQITSDFAMFSAKQAGRKIIQPYDRKLADKFENKIIIEKDLIAAIEHDDLELFYQPQVDLHTNRANAVEALIRWNHPTRGMVPPDEFIGVAEDTGLMPIIGSWVMNEACRQAAEWNNTLTTPIRVAVNVSVHQIVQADFVQSVFDTVERHGLTPQCIELEVTESIVMADIKWVVKSLNALKDYGIRIALDDFGTGYSSLSQLQELPLDCLKIDRSFIDKLDSDSSNMKSVTETIASIAKVFNLETVAEGIETESQFVEVNKLGIDVAQGYFYSKPVAKHEVIDAINAINEWAIENNRLAA